MTWTTSMSEGSYLTSGERSAGGGAGLSWAPPPGARRPAAMTAHRAARTREEDRVGPSTRDIAGRAVIIGRSCYARWPPRRDEPGGGWGTREAARVSRAAKRGGHGGRPEPPINSNLGGVEEVREVVDVDPAPAAVDDADRSLRAHDSREEIAEPGARERAVAARPVDGLAHPRGPVFAEMEKPDPYPVAVRRGHGVTDGSEPRPLEREAPGVRTVGDDAVGFVGAGQRRVHRQGDAAVGLLEQGVHDVAFEHDVPEGHDGPRPEVLLGEGQ